MRSLRSYGAWIAAFLLSLGIDLTSEQQTKTKTALEFFTSAKQTA